jgi:hypothetical protein
MSDNNELAPLDLLRLIPRLEAAKMRGVSARTLDALFSQHYVAISERRKALRLYLVLDLPSPRLPTQTQPVPPKAAPRKHAYGVAASRLGRPRAVQAEPETVGVK